MYRKILVAYDGSPESRLALDECIRLAPGPAAAIHLAGVVHDPSLYVLAGEYVPEIALGDDEARVDADIREAAAQLAAHGLAVTRHVVIGEPVTVIARFVEELGIDLLILGHPRSTTFALRWWRGSTDALLLERVRCSILVAAGPGHD
ncbi:MAG TPA: universal stress protein [Casimicrobiaceae bacterium]